ncbi:hypothetical protein BGW80DRAFT_576236 [Lactifluus volemus]|nr:hypothetical protein BGW80DRAFT_576236 [Lactifluus volemus]
MVYLVVRHLSPRLRPVPHYLIFVLYWERTFDNQRFRFPTSHRQVLVMLAGGLSYRINTNGGMGIRDSGGQDDSVGSVADIVQLPDAEINTDIPNHYILEAAPDPPTDCDDHWQAFGRRPELHTMSGRLSGCCYHGVAADLMCCALLFDIPQCSHCSDGCPGIGKWYAGGTGG